MKLSPAWAANLELEDNAVSTQMSIRLVDSWIELFLNIQAEFVVQSDELKLDNLAVGKLQVPDALLQLVIANLRENLGKENAAFQDFRELLANVERVTIDANEMNVALQWDPVLISRISDQTQRLFISDGDQQRIVRHYQLITEVAATIPTDIRAVSLNTFLIPLFADAYERSQNGSDPIAENRTLLQTLAIYVNNQNIAQLVGETLAADIPPARFVEVRLQRRQDLAQHLISIAAITASAGADFAQLLSTTKEAYDARYRSGFSFSDLTANSAGVALASFSTRDYDTAIEMQKRFISLQTESDYMPEVGSNRDGISEVEFTALYNDRNSQEYLQRLAQIQLLIDARPLFQGLE
ncbi:MAG: hypothetical protein O2971_11615 [Proteobacteria bacterium]|nr:hypothetical protein [Pseudomonadota bacterium]